MRLPDTSENAVKYVELHKILLMLVRILIKAQIRTSPRISVKYSVTPYRVYRIEYERCVVVISWSYPN